jgi:hypothetical protein
VEISAITRIIVMINEFLLSHYVEYLSGKFILTFRFKFFLRLDSKMNIFNLMQFMCIAICFNHYSAEIKVDALLIENKYDHESMHYHKHKLRSQVKSRNFDLCFNKIDFKINFLREMLKIALKLVLLNVDQEKVVTFL